MRAVAFAVALRVRGVDRVARRLQRGLPLGGNCGTHGGRVRDSAGSHCQVARKGGDGRVSAMRRVAVDHNYDAFAWQLGSLGIADGALDE